MYLWTTSIVSSINASLFLYFRTAFVEADTLLCLGAILISTYPFLYFRPTLILSCVRLRALFYFGAATMYFKRNVFALFALLMESISLTSVSMKKLVGRGEFLVTFGAFFTDIWGNFCTYCYFSSFHCASAFFAVRSQSMFSCFVGMEVFSSSRKGFFTYRALLLRSRIGYSVTHDRNYLSVITPGLFTVAPGSTILPHHYTTRPPLKQLQEVHA